MQRLTTALVALAGIVLGIAIGLSIAYFPGFGIQPEPAVSTIAQPTPASAVPTTTAPSTVVRDDSIPGTVQLRPSNEGDSTKPGRLFTCDVENYYQPVSVDFSGSTDVQFMKVTGRSVMDRNSTEVDLDAQAQFVLTFDGDPTGFYPSAVIVDMLSSAGSHHIDQHVLDITVDDVAAGTFTIDTESLNPDAYVSDVVICA